MVGDTPCPLPTAAVWRADESWRAIDFISDLHLCEAQPKTFDAWAAYMRRSAADAIVILGDLFDFWNGDDAGDLPFEGRCLQVLSECAARKWVGLMVGNRDFLITPALLERCGVRPLQDPTLLDAWRQPLLLTHGDALCLDDVAYQKFRLWTRSPEVQRDFLSRPLAERLRVAASFRHASEAGRHQTAPAEGSEHPYGDIDLGAAVACLRDAEATRMIHGHTHRPGDSPLATGFDRMVLSDWDLDAGATRAEVLRCTRSGLARLSLADTC